MRETEQIRQGEELDGEKLAQYLREQMGGVRDELVIEQFPAGSSNLTYLIRSGSDDYVLRRPPFGNTVPTAHDMRREFDVLSKLSLAYAPAPRPVLFCEDETIIGAEFYLMERRRGMIIRGRAPVDLENSAGQRQAVTNAFIQNLANLHSIDHDAIGLSDLGDPNGYPRRQVEGWTKRYSAAKTHDHAELEMAISWLNTNIPNESGACLIHNDYKFDNVMLDPNDLTRITAVLDWEMVTVGDPLMDLGTTLGYWMDTNAGEKMLSMPFNPRILMENISRSALVEMYAEASGRDVTNILYYYVFGTFKIAVIAQQIYSRYSKGFTSDGRFAGFHLFVGALGTIATEAIGRGTI